jgi:hypothetical protein
MNQWKLLTIPFVALLLLSPTAAAAARTETRSYEAAAIIFSISGIDDNVGFTNDGFIDIGGVSFATQGTDTTVTISIEDSVKAVIDPTNKNRVAAIVCQDIDGDSICDVEQTFCGTTVVTLGSDPLGFQPGLDLVVFVYATEVSSAIINIKFCGGGPQRAFQGTVTANFA